MTPGSVSWSTMNRQLRERGAVMSEELTNEPSHKKGAKKSKKVGALDPNAVLRFHWNLHELPSSQHRAGLAGLALSVAFLKRKPERKGVCDVEDADQNGLTLVVDREGMRTLFDDVYAAAVEEVSSKSKWP